MRPLRRTQSAQRVARAKKTASILDSVMQEAGQLSNTLGNSDRSKLGEYLDSVRDIEARIQSSEKQGAQTLDLPDPGTCLAADPTGQWLWDANQESDSIVIYRVDPKTGKL